VRYKPYRKAKGNLGPFKSFFEKNFALYLHNIGISHSYEPVKVPYVVPAKNKTYTPDFVYDPKSLKRCKSIRSLEDLRGKVILELKGKLDFDAQTKMLLVRECNPWLDIRFIFPSDHVISKQKKGKNGKFRCSDWCELHGFKYYIGFAPEVNWFK